MRIAFLLCLLALLCLVLIPDPGLGKKRRKQYYDEEDVCHARRRRGNCGKRLRRFYYNVRTGRCRRFTYTGCGGNQNNFRSRRECVFKCSHRIQTNPHPVIG